MGSFYLVNLILAIVAMSYDDCQKKDQEEADEAEEAEEEDAVFYHNHLSDCVHLFKVWPFISSADKLFYTYRLFYRERKYTTRAIRYCALLE